MKNLLPLSRPRTHGTTVLFTLFLAAALMLPAVLDAQHGNPAPVILSTAGSFRVLAGTNVTNGATSTVTGDVGGTSVTNNGTINGTIFTAGETVNTALTNLAAAITDIAGRTADEALGVELGGLILGRGIYSSGTFGINGTLTLNGTASDIFIFKASTTLITGPTCAIALTGGAVWSNVYWQLGSSATIDGAFTGVILASTAITQNTGTINGRLLARDAAVTLSGSAVLPVELTRFTATATTRGMMLQWSTATETNNYGFAVQRTAVLNGAMNANSWITAGFVEGNGTTNVPKEYSFTERLLVPGTYSYRLKQIDRDGAFEYSSTVETTVPVLPATTELLQNYPNPFNPSTQLRYVLDVPSFVTLTVHTLLGEEIQTLVSGMQPAGMHSVPFHAGAHHLASGVYLYRLTAGNFVSTKRFTLLK